MSRYIKLEDAIKAITDSCKDRCLDCEFYWNDECAINDILSDLPKIEVSEDAISREDAVNALIAHFIPQTYTGEQVEQASKLARKIMANAPSVTPKEKEVIYGNEHNCIMTLFGECSYSETGCGDCAVVEKVRDALAKTQMKRQNSNGNLNDDAISREYLVKELKSTKEFYLSAWEGFSNMDDKDKARCDELDNCIATVINAPSVISKPKEGEWIPCTKEGLPLTELGRREGQKWYGYKCSKCNFIYKGNALTESPFCQNCGVGMKGEEK